MSAVRIFAHILSPRRSLFSATRRVSLKDGMTALLSLWSLLFAAGLLRLVVLDSIQISAPLSSLAIVILMCYGGALAAQLFGMCACAFFTHLHDTRADLMLSLLSSITVLFASMIRVTVHTALEADITRECVVLATGETLYNARMGIWGPALAQPLARAAAAHYCERQFVTNTLFELGALGVTLLTTLVLIAMIIWDNTLKDREDAMGALLDAEGLYPTNSDKCDF